MSLSVHIDNKKQDILILGIGSMQGLNDTMLSAEAQYPICLFLFFIMESIVFYHTTKMYQFKAKDSEIKTSPCV